MKMDIRHHVFTIAAATAMTIGVWAGPPDFTEGDAIRTVDRKGTYS